MISQYSGSCWLVSGRKRNLWTIKYYLHTILLIFRECIQISVSLNTIKINKAPFLFPALKAGSVFWLPLSTIVSVHLRFSPWLPGFSCWWFLACFFLPNRQNSKAQLPQRSPSPRNPWILWVSFCSFCSKAPNNVPVISPILLCTRLKCFSSWLAHPLSSQIYIGLSLSISRLWACW